MKFKTKLEKPVAHGTYVTLNLNMGLEVGPTSVTCNFINCVHNHFLFTTPLLSVIFKMKYRYMGKIIWNI